MLSSRSPPSAAEALPVVSPPAPANFFPSLVNPFSRLRSEHTLGPQNTLCAQTLVPVWGIGPVGYTLCPFPTSFPVLPAVLGSLTIFVSELFLVKKSWLLSSHSILYQSRRQQPYSYPAALHALSRSIPLIVLFFWFSELVLRQLPGPQAGCLTFQSLAPPPFVTLLRRL